MTVPDIDPGTVIVTSPEERSGTHYHYGTGDIDRSVLERPRDTRDGGSAGAAPPRAGPGASSLLKPLGRDDRVMDAGPRPRRDEIQPNEPLGCASA
jgi:hypothetical protein